jgi:hypothetical protein
MKNDISEAKQVSVRLPDILLYIPLWVCAMTWHLWRIATLRPMFSSLGDNGKTMGSFLLVFYAAGITRWLVTSDLNLLVILASLTIMVVMVLVVFERNHRSSSLTASILGASAAADIIAIGLEFFGIPANDVRIQLLGAEIALMFGCAWQFAREPKEVRSSGYRRHSH